MSFESYTSGPKKKNKVWSFNCFSNLVKAYPNASKSGFKMIFSVPGSGHFDVLRVVDPNLSLTIPPPQYNMVLARKNMLVLSSDDDDNLKQMESASESILSKDPKTVAPKNIFNPITQH